MKTSYIHIAFFAIIALFVNTACEKEITINTGNVEDKLVVESWMANGQTPVVLLSKSFPGYGTFNFIELLDSLYLEGASVQVFNQNGDSIQLQEVNPSVLSAAQKEELAMLFKVSPATIDFFPLPVYTDTTGTMIGQELGTYTMEIDFNNEKLSAVTSIPAQYPLDSLSFVEDDNTPGFYTVNLHLTLPQTLGNYIRYATKRNSEPFYFPSQSGATWNDLLFAGAEQITLPAERGYNDSTSVELDEFGLFEYGDTVTIVWKNISKESYDFFYSLENDGGDTPFSSPVKAVTNIEGGLGVWSGYNITYKTIIIE